MMSRKWILRTLALLVIAAIGTTAIVRHRHQRDRQKKTATAQAKKDRKERNPKVVSDPDKEPPDEPPPAPKAAPKAFAPGPAAREHLAEQAFIAALRDVFLWRSRQPDPSAAQRILLEKLSTLPCEDLSPDCRSAWQSLLQAWKSDPAREMDPQLKAQGQKAAETLNAMFKAHGDGDIVL